jgi:glutathione S-transferase
MKLYGSSTSPFVRRTRFLLRNHNFEFIKVDIFDSQQRAELIKKSPLLKIPFLEDEGQIILDSRVIFNYLVEKNFHPKLSIEKENLLSIIDGAADSLIVSLLSKRSQNPLNPETPFGRSHLDRIKNTFEYLESAVKNNSFAEWDYLSFSLFGLLDWAQFRELYSFDKYPSLMQFWENQKNRPEVQSTDPRL